MGYNYLNIFSVILRYFNCFMSAAKVEKSNKVQMYINRKVSETRTRPPPDLGYISWSAAVPEASLQHWGSEIISPEKIFRCNNNYLVLRHDPLPTRDPGQHVGLGDVAAGGHEGVPVDAALRVDQDVPGLGDRVHQVDGVAPGQLVQQLWQTLQRLQI